MVRRMTLMDSRDIDRAVSLTTRALREVAHLDWSVPAAGLEWSCHDTVVHVAEDFVAYAAQLTVRAADGYVPLEIRADEDATRAGLIDMITASAGFLSAAVALAEPGARAWHPYGRAGADGFAAMGAVETLLHTHDVLGGLGVHGWEPGPELPARILGRLFPHLPHGDDAWRTLLWATGRGELPGLARQTAWRWYAEPVVADRLLLCEISPMVGADLHAGGTGGFVWAEDGPGEGTRVAAGMVAKARAEGTYRPGWGPYAIIRASDRRAGLPRGPGRRRPRRVGVRPRPLGARQRLCHRGGAGAVRLGVRAAGPRRAGGHGGRRQRSLARGAPAGRFRGGGHRGRQGPVRPAPGLGAVARSPAGPARRHPPRAAEPSARPTRPGKQVPPW